MQGGAWVGEGAARAAAAADAAATQTQRTQRDAARGTACACAAVCVCVHGCGHDSLDAATISHPFCDHGRGLKGAARGEDEDFASQITHNVRMPSSCSPPPPIRT